MTAQVLAMQKPSQAVKAGGKAMAQTASAAIGELVENGFIFRGDGLPIFTEESIEAHIVAWTKVDDRTNEDDWKRAAIAVSAHDRHGREGVELVAAAFKVAESSIYQKIRAYKRAAECNMLQTRGLRFSHFLAAAYFPQVEQSQKFLENAVDKEWSIKQTRTEARVERARKSMPKNVNERANEDYARWTGEVRPVLLSWASVSDVYRKQIMYFVDEINGQFQQRPMSPAEMAIQKMEEGCDTLEQLAHEMSWTRDQAQSVIVDLLKAEKIREMKSDKSSFVGRGAVTPRYAVNYAPDKSNSDSEVSDDE